MYIKNVFGSFFIFDKKNIFTYVAGNWVQQANKNNRSPCSFFRKMTFAKNVDFIWTFSQGDIFLMRKCIHIKKQKQAYVTVLIFTLYSIWVHIESPQYKMICLNSPKSSLLYIWRYIFILFLYTRRISVFNHTYNIQYVNKWIKCLRLGNISFICNYNIRLVRYCNS